MFRNYLCMYLCIFLRGLESVWMSDYVRIESNPENNVLNQSNNYLYGSLRLHPISQCKYFYDYSGLYFSQIQNVAVCNNF